MGKQVIIIEENVIKSLIKDIGTFGMFAGLLWFNHEYLSGSLLIDVLFITCVIMFLLAKGSSSVRKFDSKEGAISYLTSPQIDKDSNGHI